MKKQKLELTWIGKEKRPKLEARILLEDADKSYHAKVRSEGAIFDNILIFGDNLLALKALEQEYAGKVKCVYIDPPFNTGEAFENYDDGLEHSIWLGLMYERFKILKLLLNEQGSIFVHLNDDELDYCKVILDEIFGRSNFVNRITIEARSPSAFSTVNPGVFKSSEYILWYAKNKNEFIENSGRVSRVPDYAYNKWLVNPDEDFSNWRLVSLMDAYENSPPSRSCRPDSLLEHFHNFILNNASQVCRLASISDSGAGEKIVQLKRESLNKAGKVFKLERAVGLEDVYVLDGQQLIFYKKNVADIDGKLSATALLTNVWKDIAWEGIANEGGVTFRKGKKPEKLIKRCLELATNPNDLVLDSFAGSGTTGAVAHKMGRRWIMVELGEHCHTHIIPRLQKVIDGTDQGGISKAVNWQGGGGFRYYRLAPSLIVNDKWGNAIINPDYNPAMLAEAIARLEGFTYQPSESVWWQHGFSSEQDFLYVTTQTLTAEQLQALSDEVGEGRSLLICCAAYRGMTGAQVAERFANLSVKKIPKMVLARCEWGHDDYSLNIANLPMAEPELEPKSEPASKPKTKTAKRQSAVSNQDGLFDGEDE
ncbi:site-specific DNA-methyltransferase [Testudinibacter sp. P27/CKL/0425]